MAKKVILAYSGGLDTSVCLKWLTKKGYDVIAYIADLGQGGDFNILKKRAFSTGASKVYVENLKDEFILNFCLPALKANAVYEHKYLLATALSRPLIAKGLVNAAKREKAKYVAHGCTGKGNDQVRFEVSIGALNPTLRVIAPVREWELKTRDEEIEYARRFNIPVDIIKKNPYSIDKNLWGVSIECGVLEDPWREPPDDCFQLTKSPTELSHKPVYLTVSFDKGMPSGLNGKALKPLHLIERLNIIGSRHSIGRTDLVENRLVGIKSREVYEAPAATILFEAHRALEEMVHDRELSHFKATISLKYAELIYYGLWYSTLRYALDKFIEYTQLNVTGKVRLKLSRGNCIAVGRQSPYSLYKKSLATYGKGDIFDQRLAEGFCKLWGMPYKILKIKYQKSK